MTVRTKVGKGNRKLVRELFRDHGITFPYHRDCVDNRYSFKILPYHSNGLKARQNRDKMLAKMCRIATNLPKSTQVEVVPTNRACSYPRGPQFGVAVRFKDA
jgi:hypothetical protein